MTSSTVRLAVPAVEGRVRADEIAVEAFLRGEISFASIAAVVEDTLQAVPVRQMKSVEQILDVDRQSRDRAREFAVKRQRNLMHV